MKTIAEQLKHDFKKGSLFLYDSNGNEVYFEIPDGHWYRKEYDSSGNEIYYENCYGDWIKREFDSNGNLIHHENSKGQIENNRPTKTK